MPPVIVARGAERQGMRDTAERMSRDLEGLGERSSERRRHDHAALAVTADSTRCGLGRESFGDFLPKASRLGLGARSRGD
ncbi:hypothetical protein THIOKS12210047 [Thiocapsa sp. KS1]|nr:hypothetical protein THIOKS12210047 [Thiocapsa sp. KS1]